MKREEGWMATKGGEERGERAKELGVEKEMGWRVVELGLKREEVGWRVARGKIRKGNEKRKEKKREGKKKRKRGWPINQFCERCA